MVTVEKKRLGFSVQPVSCHFNLKCRSCHMSLREGCAALLFQGSFAHSVLWLIRGKGSAKPYLLFVSFNGEALLASPCLSWDPLTLSAPCLFVLLMCAH